MYRVAVRRSMVYEERYSRNEEESTEMGYATLSTFASIDGVERRTCCVVKFVAVSNLSLQLVHGDCLAIIIIVIIIWEDLNFILRLLAPQLEKRLLLNEDGGHHLIDDVYCERKVNAGEEPARNQLVKIRAGGAQVLQTVHVQVEQQS